MNRPTLFLILFFGLALIPCKGQAQKDQADRLSIDHYKAEILPEEEMRATTDKAVKVIRDRDYEGLKKNVYS